MKSWAPVEASTIKPYCLSGSVRARMRVLQRMHFRRRKASIASGGRVPLWYLASLRRSRGDIGVIKDVAPEEVAESLEGPDHLGVGGQFPLFSSLLGQSHVDLAASDVEPHDVGRVRAHLGLVDVEAEALVVEDLLDLI